MRTIIASLFCMFLVQNLCAQDEGVRTLVHWANGEARSFRISPVSNVLRGLKGLKSKVYDTYSQRQATPKMGAQYVKVKHANNTYFCVSEESVMCHAPAFSAHHLYNAEGDWLYTILPMYATKLDMPTKIAIEDKLTQIEQPYRQKPDSNFVGMYLVKHHTGKTFYMIDFHAIPFKASYLPTQTQTRKQAYDLRLLVDQDFKVQQEIVREGTEDDLHYFAMVTPIFLQ